MSMTVVLVALLHQSLAPADTFWLIHVLVASTFVNYCKYYIEVVGWTGQCTREEW